MSAQAYELIAMGARYFFAFLGVLIVAYSVVWLRRDAARHREAVRRLPDAGMVGQIVNEVTGECQPLPREGVLGSARDCDVRVTGEGVLRRHAAFSFVEGEGVRFTSILGGMLYEGDEPIPSGETLTHGARFEVGGARLRIRLFEGLNVPLHAALMRESPAPGDLEADAEPEGAWAFAPYPVEAVRGYYDAAQPLDATVRMRPIPAPTREDDVLADPNPFGERAGDGRRRRP